MWDRVLRKIAAHLIRFLGASNPKYIPIVMDQPGAMEAPFNRAMCCWRKAAVGLAPPLNT